MRMLVVLSFLLLAACGQAGDLYLPAEPAEPAEPAGAAPAPADTPPDPEKDKDRK